MRARVLAGLLVLLPLLAQAAIQVTVKVTGVDGAMRDNVLASLSIERQKADPRLTESLESNFERTMTTVIADITPDDSEGLNLISSLGQVLDSVANNGILKLKVKLPVSRLGKLKSASIDFITAGD